MAITFPRANLNDQVYETLRTRLLAREPGAGAKLSLHELATELGVSRSPVHHALTRLVSEGLLTVKARRGYFVTPVTEQALEDGYAVRLVLELHAAEQTVGRLTADQIARFRELQAATAESLSHEEWDATNAAFHEYQVDLAKNSVLSRVYRELSVNLMMQVIRGGKLERDLGLADDHRAIVDAFEAADLVETKRAISAHVATGAKIALDAIERAGGAL